jgi:hypothetical protein
LRAYAAARMASCVLRAHAVARVRPRPHMHTYKAYALYISTLKIQTAQPHHTWTPTSVRKD